MDTNVHHYDLEGLAIDIPLKKRKDTCGYIEDCSDLIDNPKYTPLGHPVILTNNEACELFEKEFEDCADCKFFQKAKTEHFTLIGICTHQSQRKQTDKL